jgi:hypothetical protein
LREFLKTCLALALCLPLPASAQALVPGEYEANREALRQVYRYWAELGQVGSDPELRHAFRGMRPPRPYVAQRAPGRDAAIETEARRELSPPPPVLFVSRAPDLGELKDTERGTARELMSRYESAAAHASAAGANAARLRESLAARGMAMNVQTAASVARLAVFLDEAAEMLRAHDWEQAGAALEKTEYEAQKIFRDVGR